MSTFSLTVLGSNSALPTIDRFSTAQLLNVNERFFLIDCAEGTQLQLRRFKIRYLKINHIFISHLHGDHYYGIFGLLSSLNLSGKKGEVHIYAHPNLEKLLNLKMQFSEPFMFDVVFHPLNSKLNEVIYEDKNITVETIPLKHRIPSCGFLFREKEKPKNIIKEKIEAYNISIKDILKIKKGEDLILDNGQTIPNKALTKAPAPLRSYAFCSDTIYREQIIPIVKNVDLLYHEASFLSNKSDFAKRTYHSTAAQAATIAKKADVKKLLIGHFSARYKKTEDLLNEACAVFPNTIAAYDGLRVDI